MYLFACISPTYSFPPVFQMFRREQTPSSSTQQSSGDSQQNGFNEETVRRLLIQRPYSTKELVGKFKTKNPVSFLYFSKPLFK